jgi:hypothetical protein
MTDGVINHEEIKMVFETLKDIRGFDYYDIIGRVERRWYIFFRIIWLLLPLVSWCCVYSWAQRRDEKIREWQWNRREWLNNVCMGINEARFGFKGWHWEFSPEGTYLMLKGP